VLLFVYVEFEISCSVFIHTPLLALVNVGCPVRRICYFRLLQGFLTGGSSLRDIQMLGKQAHSHRSKINRVRSDKIIHEDYNGHMRALGKLRSMFVPADT